MLRSEQWALARFVNYETFAGYGSSPASSSRSVVCEAHAHRKYSALHRGSA